jgi:hypothetical protein
MCEISENLHRAALTQLERSDQIAEWVKLCGEEREKIWSQAEVNPESGRPKAGERAVADALGLDKDEVYRSVKIASITPAAKEAAIEVGIDNNQSKLLQVAKEKPAEQVATVIKLATI